MTSTPQAPNTEDASSWPHTRTTLQEMMKAGWTYDPTGCAVKCMSCGLTCPDDYFDDQSFENPLQYHKQHTADSSMPTLLRCPFLVALEVPAMLELHSQGDVCLVFYQDEEKKEYASEPSTILGRMKVSSMHLMDISPVFKNMFGPNFAEGIALHTSGSIEVPIYDDYAAMEIVMSIIHCRSRKISPKITMEMLTVISVIVDKYQCHEAMGFHTDIWFSNLEEERPKNVLPGGRLRSDPNIGWGGLRKPDWDPSTYPWLCICHVLKKEDELAMVINRAVETSGGCIDTLESKVPMDLPVPISTINGIEEKRQILIHKMLATFEEVFAKIEAEIKMPTSQAELGAQAPEWDHQRFEDLKGHLREHRLWPIPEAPYHGISLQSIFDVKMQTKLELPQSWWDWWFENGTESWISWPFGDPVAVAEFWEDADQAIDVWDHARQQMGWA